jgi:hypothetical protein
MTPSDFSRRKLNADSRWRRKGGNAIDFATIGRLALRHAHAICGRVLPGGRRVGNEYVVRNPKRDDENVGSFKVNLQTGRWADFATGERGGDLISLVAWRYDAPQLVAARQLAIFVGLLREGSR